MYICVCYKIFMCLTYSYTLERDISYEIYLLLICDFNKLRNLLFVNLVRTIFFKNLYIFSEFLLTSVFTKNSSPDQPLNLSTYDYVGCFIFLMHYLNILVT